MNKMYNNLEFGHVEKTDLNTKNCLPPTSNTIISCEFSLHSPRLLLFPIESAFTSVSMFSTFTLHLKSIRYQKKFLFVTIIPINILLLTQFSNCCKICVNMTQDLELYYLHLYTL